MNNTTLGEQYQAILSSMRDLERELLRTKDEKTKQCLLDNIESLHDAAETINQLDAFAKFIGTLK